MKIFSNSYKFNKKILLVLGFAFLLIAGPALATTTGGGLPYEDWMTKIVASVTGPVAFTVSVVAFVAAGSTLIFGGEIQGFLKSLLFIVLVLGFVIGAKNMLSAITGQGAELCCSIPHAAGKNDHSTNFLLFTTLLSTRSR